MLWFIFAFFSALISAVQNMLHRKVMFTANPYAYAFLENLFSGLIFVPFAIMAWSTPSEPVAWFLLIIGGILWSFIAVIIMFSYKHTKVSLRAPVNESRTLWVVVLSAIFLAEAITAQKIIGVAVIFAGVVFLTYKKGTKLGSFADKGVRLTLLSAFLLALVAIVDKKALSYFDASVYGMFMYLIPTIVIGSYALTHLRKDVHDVMATQKVFLTIVVIAGALSYFLQLKAYTLADVSLVYPVLRLGTIFTVLGGIIFLHEREEIMRKIVASLIVVAGVVIVSGYYTLF